MLGQAVRKAIERRGGKCVVAINRFGTPIRLEQVEPNHILENVVINCAGWVSQREGYASQFIAANALGPQRLAQACSVAGARLVQVSTDCVFVHPGPHTEFSPVSGSDSYARSKYAGEVTFPPHVTVRTSFVGFGERGLIHQLQTQAEVHASRNLLWSGHMVRTVAELLLEIGERRDILGLLHVPGEFMSRFDLVSRLVSVLNLPTRIVEDNAFVADRRLVSERWGDFGLSLPPPFTDQLERIGLVQSHKPLWARLSR